jgi:hypothetical protein
LEKVALGFCDGGTHHNVEVEMGRQGIGEIEE